VVFGMIQLAIRAASNFTIHSVYLVNYCSLEMMRKQFTFAKHRLTFLPSTFAFGLGLLTWSFVYFQSGLVLSQSDSR